MALAWPWLWIWPRNQAKAKMMQEHQGLAASDGLGSKYGRGLHSLTIDLRTGAVANSVVYQAARIIADKDDRRLRRPLCLDSSLVEIVASPLDWAKFQQTIALGSWPPHLLSASFSWAADPSVFVWNSCKKVTVCYIANSLLVPRSI